MNPDPQKWKIEQCPHCEGRGKFEDTKCLVCNGEGLWEVYVDDNYLATQFLIQQEGDFPEHVIKLCNTRLQGITPDNILTVLDRLQNGLIPGELEEKNFMNLHQAGAKRWVWSWLNANRFVIELAKLNNVDYTKYRYALCSLVFGWLKSEELTD